MRTTNRCTFRKIELIQRPGGLTVELIEKIQFLPIYSKPQWHQNRQKQKSYFLMFRVQLFSKNKQKITGRQTLAQYTRRVDVNILILDINFDHK